MMDFLASQLSDRLKSLRQSRGWSLDVTSQHTGVSKAMLGQIERGESSPTIQTLWKIASGFDVAFSSFVNHVGPHPSASLGGRSGLQQKLHQQNDQINVTTIFPFDAQLGFEVFTIELLPGCTHLSPSHQKGVVEHVVSVNGIVEVLVGEHWHSVAPHEGRRFQADSPHGYRNLTDEPVLFYDMIHYLRCAQ